MSAPQVARSAREIPVMPRGRDAGKKVSVILAVAVHLALAAFLFYGVHWQTKPQEAVEVSLVRPETTQAPAVEPTPPAPPEPPPVQKAEPAPPPPEPAKPDIAIKTKEPPKLPPKEVPKPFDPFQEQLKREADQLNARKAVEAATQEVSRMKASQAAQSASARSKAMTTYLGRIIGAIKPRITLPPDLKGNPEAVFAVAQLPSGEILSVKLKKSSGNPVLDANIERAILKSSPLPKPDQSELFSRDLELKFRPLDE